MKKVDLVGKTYGKWKVIRRANKRAYWECTCACGTEKEVFHGHLVAGKSRSCGCPTYPYNHPLYSVWRGIKVRCFTCTNANYPRYGEKGIGMSIEWKESFPDFRDWALSNGWEPGLTLERKDCAGDYTPENCTFIPRSEQPHNRSNTLFVEWEGERLPLAKLISRYGLPYGTVDKRLRRGWSLTEAILTPTRRYKRNRN